MRFRDSPAPPECTTDDDCGPFSRCTEAPEGHPHAGTRTCFLDRRRVAVVGVALAGSVALVARS